MKNMKAKRFLSIIAVSAFLLFSGGIACAAPVGGEPAANPVGGTADGIKIVNPLEGGDLTVDQIVERVINFLLLIGGPIAALMYVYAGFQFLTAGGDARKIVAAKNTILWTSIGVAVLVLSFGIVEMVKSLLSP